MEGDRLILSVITAFIFVLVSIGFYLGASKFNPNIQSKLRSIPASVLTLVIIWFLLSNTTLVKNIWYLSSFSLPSWAYYYSFITIFITALFLTIISYTVSYFVLWVIMFHFERKEGNAHVLVNYIIAPLICVAISTVYISNVISSFS